MIESIKVKTKNECDELWKTHPALADGTSSSITAENFPLYIAAVGHLILYSPEHISAAINTAKRDGLDVLENFLKQKKIEETGHDQWARSDLAALDRGNDLQIETINSPAVKSFLLWIYDVARNDLISYLTYIYSVEYITGYLGPKFLALVEKNTGIARDRSTVLAKHADIDGQHADEILPWISWLAETAAEPHVQNKIFSSIERCATFTNELMSEIFENKKTYAPNRSTTPAIQMEIH